VERTGRRLNATANLVSPTRGFAGSCVTPGAERVDARTVVDLLGEVDIVQGISAYATVQNVAFSPAGARPGAPRLALAGMRARF
jgi:Fe(3+) dicitrate transport protein